MRVIIPRCRCCSYCAAPPHTRNAASHCDFTVLLCLDGDDDDGGCYEYGVSCQKDIGSFALIRVKKIMDLSFFFAPKLSWIFCLHFAPKRTWILVLLRAKNILDLWLLFAPKRSWIFCAKDAPKMILRTRHRHRSSPKQPIVHIPYYTQTLRIIIIVTFNFACSFYILPAIPVTQTTERTHVHAPSTINLRCCLLQKTQRLKYDKSVHHRPQHHR